MSSLGPCRGLRTCLRRGPPHVQSGALSGSEDLSQERTPTCPVWGLVGVRGPVSGEDPHMSSLGPCGGPRTCLRRGPPHVQSGALWGSEDLSQGWTPTCPVWGLVGVRGPVSGEDPHMSSLGPCRGPRTCLRRGPPHVQSGALSGSEDLSQERTPTCPVWGLVGVRGPVSGEDPHMSSLGPCRGLRTCLRRGAPHVQCVHTHTDIHTYRHTYTQTYIHTDMQTYIHTDIQTYMHLITFSVHIFCIRKSAKLNIISSSQNANTQTPSTFYSQGSEAHLSTVKTIDHNSCSFH